ncbi:unnamed protein product [Calypogeia fissa]
MELELGLTPGWLLQRSCKVYLFISSSKKIVGCLMAEPITSAFRVVSAQCQSSRNGVKLNQSDGQYKKPSIMATDLQSTMKESSTQRDRRSHEADKSEPGFIEGESCLLPKSSSERQSAIDEECLSATPKISLKCRPEASGRRSCTVKRCTRNANEGEGNFAKMLQLMTEVQFPELEADVEVVEGKFCT